MYPVRSVARCLLPQSTRGDCKAAVSATEPGLGGLFGNDCRSGSILQQMIRVPPLTPLTSLPDPAGKGQKGDSGHSLQKEKEESSSLCITDASWEVPSTQQRMGGNPKRIGKTVISESYGILMRLFTTDFGTSKISATSSHSRIRPKNICETVA